MTSRIQVTTPRELPDDRKTEQSLRPTRLSHFVGQKRVRESLSIAIQAAHQRGDPLDHILFHGPAGLGKTTLASLLASEMGVNIRTTSGPALERPADLVGLLTNLRAGDILFIDEIHRLRPDTEEFLYPAMEDWKVELRMSDGPKAQMMTMAVERFTLVGATTRFGLLTAPMRARFGIAQRLNFYPMEDLAEIAARSASILGIKADDEGILAIARRSRGTPRVANRLLRRVRDYAEVRGTGVIDGGAARGAMDLLEVDEHGLDETDTQLLRTLIERFDGGPVGLASLAVAMSEDSRTLEEVYEPFLIQRGFMKRTAQGRVATVRAFRHLDLDFPEDGGQGRDGPPGGSQRTIFS